jgi:hypothetical protein
MAEGDAVNAVFAGGTPALRCKPADGSIQAG